MAQCHAAVAEVFGFLGHEDSASLVVVQGYRHCLPWARCPLSVPPPSGWPLSAMVAVRFNDGTRPVMVNVPDVAAITPAVVPMGNDPAIMLAPYDSGTPKSSG